MFKIKIIHFIIFLFIVILCACLFLASTIKRKEPMSHDRIELVIARYNEDLEWLKDEPFSKYPVIIYNKGDNENFYRPPNLKNVVNLDNVGVCVHTYLYHIINDYNSLADVTVFLPGSCMDEHKKQLTLNTINTTEFTNNSVFFIHQQTQNGVNVDLYDFTLEKWHNTNSKNREKNSYNELKPCSIRPFGNWYNKVFPGITVNYINYTGIFSVSREHILNRSKESYMDLIRYVDSDKNEEAAHYFERAFLAVFHPIPEECSYRIDF